MAGSLPGFFATWARNKGRNGWDQPMAIADDQCAEAYNVELREGGLGTKREGSSIVTLTGDTYSGLRSLGRFVPSNNDANAELWIASGDGTTKILKVPTTGVAVNMTLKDNVAANPSFWNGASLNNKLFQAYDSTTNRLQVYAPNESATAIRRAGLVAPGAATVANTGAGTYSAVLRYYRVRVLAKVGTTVVRTSEAGASVSFTPSGAGTAARVTQPATLPGEGETHWIVEGSADDATYWQLSGELAIATTTWDDTTIPNNYPQVGDTPPANGACYPFPSCKYIVSDGTRLLGLGVWETTATTGSLTPVSGRLYFTPVLGTSDLGDDERCQNTTDASGWIDLALGAGGDDRGIGLVNNVVYAFQSSSVFMFVPTTNPDTPYRRVPLSKSVGAISHKSIVQAEDENGQPALYFLDPASGPYRIVNGSTLEWLGKDVADLWGSQMLYSNQVAWGVYDQSRKLVIFGVRSYDNAVGDPNFTSIILCYDTTNGVLTPGDAVRKGWTYWDGKIASAYGAVYHNYGIAASPSTTRRSVYYAEATAGALYMQTKGLGLGKDGSTTYQSYITSRAFSWEPLGRDKKLLDAILIGKARNSTTVRQRLISDWGLQTQDQTISLAPIGSDTYVRPRPAPVDFAQLRTMQVQLGDASAVDTQWELELWEGNVELQKDAR